MIPHIQWYWHFSSFNKINSLILSLSSCHEIRCFFFVFLFRILCSIIFLGSSRSLFFDTSNRFPIDCKRFPIDCNRFPIDCNRFPRDVFLVLPNFVYHKHSSLVVNTKNTNKNLRTTIFYFYIGSWAGLQFTHDFIRHSENERICWRQRNVYWSSISNR